MLPYFVLFGRAIPLYGVCMAAGIALAALLAIFRAKRAGMDENDMIVILACAVGLGLVGAKALYLGVTYGLKGTLNLLRTGYFAILVESGQVYYGGLLFGIAGAVIAAMCLRVKGENVAYAVVPALPLGHAFGRIGCFLGGCCYGLPCGAPWGVDFSAAGVTGRMFPIQLVEAFLNLLLAAALTTYAKKAQNRWNILLAYMGAYGILRFSLEFFRGDLARGMGGGLSTSQWISLTLMLAALAAALLLRGKRLKGAK